MFASGLISIGSLWIGVNASLPPSPSALSLYGCTALSIASLLLMLRLVGWSLLAPPESPTRSRGTAFAVRAAVILYASAVLTLSVFLWVGHYLARHDAFGTRMQASTETAPVFLDGTSDELLREFDFGNGLEHDAELRRQFSSYLRQFPPTTRHSILSSLNQLRADIPPQQWAAFIMGLGALDQYPRNLFTFIEFLETDVRYRYLSNAPRRRLPERANHSPHELQALWSALTGHDYSISGIVSDWHQSQAIFSKPLQLNQSRAATRRIYSDKHNRRITALFEELAAARSPLAMKMAYAVQLHNAPVLLSVRAENIDRAVEAISSMSKASWQSAAQELQALLFAAKTFELTRSPKLSAILMQRFGTWDTLVMAPAPEAHEFFEEFIRYQDFVPEFAEHESQADPLPAFMGNWTFEQVRTFYVGFQKLVGKRPDKTKQWTLLIRLASKSGIAIVPELPETLGKPAALDRLAADYAIGRGVIDGTCTIADRRTFAQVRSFRAFSLVFARLSENRDSDLSNTFFRHISRLEFGPSLGRFDMAQILRSARYSDSQFSRLVTEAINRKSGHDQLTTEVELSVRTFDGFEDALGQLAFLSEFDDFVKSQHGRDSRYDGRSNHPDSFGKFARRLATQDIPWARYVGQMTGDHLRHFAYLTRALAVTNRDLAFRLTRLFFSANYPHCGTIDGFRELAVLEQQRVVLNSIDPTYGDAFVVECARVFVASNPVTSTNIDELLSVALEYKFDAPSENRDVNELYGLIGYFVGTHVLEYVQNDLARADESVRVALRTLGITALDTPSTSLPSRMGKLAVYVVQGDWGYVWRRLRPEVQSVSTAVGAATVQADGFALGEAFEARSVVNGQGEELAYLFVGDPARGARVSMAFDVGYQIGGISAKDFRSLREGGRLVMDFPLGFTAGKGTPTDIAIEQGRVQSWVLSADRSHALVIVYRDDTLRIANKLELRISDLYREKEDLPSEDRMLDLRNIDDYFLFLDIAKAEELSVASNMLLIDGETLNLVPDEIGDRRLLVQFDDGRFGVLNLNTRTSTASATKLAFGLRLQSGARVVKAVYADTGYFDYCTVYTDSGPMLLGYADHPSSANRMFLYQQAE